MIEYLWPILTVVAFGAGVFVGVRMFRGYVREAVRTGTLVDRDGKVFRVTQVRGRRD
jgi:hypothetical protein